MDLRRPHVAVAVGRPGARGEHVAPQLPVHQVGGVVDGEGVLRRAVRGVVGGSNSQVSPARQREGRGVRVVGVYHRIGVPPHC